MRVWQLTLLMVGLAGLSSCGHLRTAPEGTRVSTLEGQSEESLSGIDGTNDDIATSPAANNIPIEVNKQVDKWVNYFQGRGRRYMETYLERSSRYLPMMKAELRAQGLPEDLVYVSLIESGFSHKAHSHASAVGYWQFIRETGKAYGLKIDAFVDERRDPVLSTQAAGRYFKALHNLFGNWYLSLASYNTGENRIKRLVMKHYTRDFWELARRRRMPRETIEYVPKFLAATLIGKNPELYGFKDIAYEPQLTYDTIEIDKPISLQKFASGMSEISYESLRLLNPMYRTYYVPVTSGQKITLRVPKGMTAQALEAVDMAYSTPPRFVATEFRYKVRRGDSLSVIARRYRTTVGTLRRLNNLSNRSFIRVGQRLRVPERERTQEIAYEETNPTSNKKSRAEAVSYHTVRKGENLGSIARKYHVTLNEIRSINNIGRRAVIYVGQKLAIKSEKQKVHVVRRGDTLIYIARRYGVNVSQISAANQLSNRSHIMIGSELVIP